MQGSRVSLRCHGGDAAAADQPSTRASSIAGRTLDDVPRGRAACRGEARYHGAVRASHLALIAIVAASTALQRDGAWAHPLAPSLLELHETSGGRAEMTWKMPLLRAPGAAPEPGLSPRCHPLGP